MAENGPYTRSWDERRKRLFWLWASMIGFAVSLHIWPPLAVVCGIGALYWAAKYYEFKCPRCRERFMPFPRGDLLRLWWSQQCQCCGLRVNEIPAEAWAAVAESSDKDKA
jgi:hypothetical protein